MKLFFLHLKVCWYRLKEGIKIVFKYYPNLSFLFLDMLLMIHFLFKSPYRVHKAYLKKKKQKNLYTYGETPLTTLDYIARECRILSKDCVYELGSGSGRVCFWLRCFIGCRVVGIEQLELFVQRAQKMVQMIGLSKIEFRLEDFMKTHYRGVTFIYLYGTSLSDSLVRELALLFKNFKPQTKVITVSYSLNEYLQEGYFKVIKEFPAKFYWGTATVYLQERL